MDVFLGIETASTLKPFPALAYISWVCDMHLGNLIPPLCLIRIGIFRERANSTVFTAGHAIGLFEMYIFIASCMLPSMHDCEASGPCETNLPFVFHIRFNLCMFSNR